MGSPIVIPAQAGTQPKTICRRMAASFRCSVWAPAYAGVTVGRDV